MRAPPALASGAARRVRVAMEYFMLKCIVFFLSLFLSLVSGLEVFVMVSRIKSNVSSVQYGL